MPVSSPMTRATASLVVALAGAASNTQASDDLSYIKAKASEACPDDLGFLVGEWRAHLDGRPFADAKWEAPYGPCFLIQTHMPLDLKHSPYLVVVAYDKALRNWSMLGASAYGERVRFENGIAEAMRIEFQTMDMNDDAVRRFSYASTSADTIREMQERSEDGGKTWSVEYDFTWTRKIGGK